MQAPPPAALPGGPTHLACQRLSAADRVHPAFLPPAPYPLIAVGFPHLFPHHVTRKRSFTIDAILGSGSPAQPVEDYFAGERRQDTAHGYITPYQLAQDDRVTALQAGNGDLSYDGDGGASEWQRCKGKRVRTIFTPEQLDRLETEFERQQYMVGTERYYLAGSLKLTEAQVKVWFQNRRIKWRKQHLEAQQARLAKLDLLLGDLPLGHPVSGAGLGARAGEQRTTVTNAAHSHRTAACQVIYDDRHTSSDVAHSLDITHPDVINTQREGSYDVTRSCDVSLAANATETIALAVARQTDQSRT